MIISKIEISNSLIKKIYQIMLYIIPIAMFSNFFLNTILVIICFIFWYYIISNKDFTWIKNKINLLLIFFSIYIIIQGYFVDNNNSFFKSIFYLKFIFFFISFDYFSKQFQIVIQKIFKFYLLVLFIFSIDLIIQYIFGVNTINLPCKMSCMRYSGFFGSELVAGGYLYFFGLASITFFLIKKDLFKYFMSSFLLLILILITGDRTPFFSILLVIILSLMLIKNIRIYLYYFIPIIFILLSTILLTSENINRRYVLDINQLLSSSELNISSLKSYQKTNTLEIQQVKESIKNKEKWNIKLSGEIENLNYLVNEQIKLEHRINKVRKIVDIRKNQNLWYYKFFDTVYGAHYLTAVNIIKDNFFFGTGIRSFRNICKQYNDVNSLNLEDACSTHPHNLHLEILSEVGVVGYLLLSISVILLILNLIKKKKYRNEQIWLLIVFLVLVFPFKPTGAFFSSWSGFIFWYSFALANSASNQNYKKNSI
jgi:O-antigen ligase